MAARQEEVLGLSPERLDLRGAKVRLLLKRSITGMEFVMDSVSNTILCTFLHDQTEDVRRMLRAWSG
jgi:hypothetical protein